MSSPNTHTLKSLYLHLRAKKKEAKIPRKEEKRIIFDPNTENEKMSTQPTADPERLNPYKIPALCGFSDRRILITNPAHKKGTDKSM